MNPVKFQGQVVFPKIFTQPDNPFKKVFTPPADWKLDDWRARPDEFYFVDLSKTDEKGNKIDDLGTDVAAVAEFLKPNQNIPFAFKTSQQATFMHSADNPFRDQAKIIPAVVQGNPFSWIPPEHR